MERGARVLAHNRRVGRAEIDLLVVIGSEVVAVEVKTRRGDEEDPSWAVDLTQLRRIRRAAGTLARRAARVDLVGVAIGDDGVTIRWLPGVA